MEPTAGRCVTRVCETFHQPRAISRPTTSNLIATPLARRHALPPSPYSTLRQVQNSWVVHFAASSASTLLERETSKDTSNERGNSYADSGRDHKEAT